jgi:TPR repeat protein
MASNPIGSAPEKHVILRQNESPTVGEVSRWSTEKDGCVDQTGAPIRIIPRHWTLLAGASSRARPENLPACESGALRRMRRVGLHAGLSLTASVAVLLLPSYSARPAADTETAQIWQLAQTSPGAQTQARVRTGDRTDAGDRVEAPTEPVGGAAPVSASDLEKERQLIDALAHQLAMVREELHGLKGRLSGSTKQIAAAQSAQAAAPSDSEHNDALEDERQRGETLARDLESVQAELEILKARLAEAIATATAPTQSNMQTADASPPEAQPTAIGLASASPSASVGRRSADDETSAKTKVSSGRGGGVAMRAPEPQAAMPGNRSRVAALLPASEEQIALWMKRGEDFIAVGDFVSARLVLQRAAEAGHAPAALALASTYDPNVLERFRAKGLPPDIGKARSWYEQAAALGSPEAARRLELLIESGR